MKSYIRITAGLILTTQILFAGDVILTNRAMDNIEKSVETKKCIIPVDKDNLEVKRKLINSWTNASINLQKADKRESKRFKRTSYKVKTQKNRMRLLNESVNSNGIFDIPQGAVTTTVQPYIVLYREGFMHFSFTKTLERKAQSKIDDRQVLSLARKFITENNFIEESKLDKIGPAEINEIRIDAEIDNSGDNDDYLVMQNVTFRRTYSGKPVVNSQISLSVFPDTREILELNHFNWPSLLEDRKLSLSESDLKKSGVSTAEGTRKKIVKRINGVTGPFDQAFVNSVEQGWFQGNEELIPVLIIKYEAVFEGNKEPVKHLEVVNLVGDENVFGKDFRDDYIPLEYPNEQ